MCVNRSGRTGPRREKSDSWLPGAGARDAGQRLVAVSVENSGLAGSSFLRHAPTLLSQDSAPGTGQRRTDSCPPRIQPRQGHAHPFQPCAYKAVSTPMLMTSQLKNQTRESHQEPVPDFGGQKKTKGSSHLRAAHAVLEPGTSPGGRQAWRTTRRVDISHKTTSPCFDHSFSFVFCCPSARI